MHPDFAALPGWANPWPGRAILHGLPDAEYHSARSIISKSALDRFARSPLHYRYHMTAPPEPTAEWQAIGHALHTNVLEPDLFDRKVLEIPDFGSLRKPDIRAIRQHWMENEGAGKTLLTAGQLMLVEAMGDAVRSHPAVAAMLDARGEPEVTALWTCPETGLPCKARGDWVSQMRGVLLDLKTAESAAPDAFRRAVISHRYHVQDALYSRAFEENGQDIAHFVFVVVEKEPPYAVACYQLDDTARMKGEELYQHELRALRACIDADRWPGYGDKVMDLSLPGWATQSNNT